MFNPGEYAYDKLNSERVQILAVSEVWGFVSYKVYRPSDKVVYKLAADAITTDSSEAICGHNENYIRYVALLSKIKNETSGGVLSKLSSGIIPLPHQRYVLECAIGDNNGLRQTVGRANYQLLVDTAERLPEAVITEDDKLLMYIDLSAGRV